MSDNSECQELFEEATELIDISLSEAAEIFEEAAKCFDKISNRKSAAQAYSLAGQLYLEANKDKLSADCYGKAVLRQMMIGNYEEANILLNIGKEHGFNTFHFRTAEDSLTKRIEDENLAIDNRDQLIVDELDEIEEIPFEIEEIILEDALLDEIKNETIDTSRTDIQDDHIPVIVKGYRLSKSYSSDTEMADKRADLIARSIISRERSEIKKSKLKGSAVASHGSNIRILKPITNIRSLRDARRENKNIIQDTFLKEEKTTKSNGMESKKLEFDSLDQLESDKLDIEFNDTNLDNIIAVDSTFIGSTEIIAEEELEDIELIDTIPYRYNIQDIETSTGIEFVEKKLDLKQKSMIYTWKISKLDIGEKAKIDYIMTSRVVRTAVAQIEDKMVLFNSYHSLQEKEDQKSVKIAFNNNTGKKLNSIMIEDIIPPELVIREYKPEISPPPQRLIVSDTIVYRWFFNNIEIDEEIEMFYKFDSKAITRWYEKIFVCDNDKILIKKIIQPIHHALNVQYLVVYIIKPEFQVKLTIEDQIPAEYNIVATEPAFYHPKVTTSLNNQNLKWKFELEKDQSIKLAIRLSGNKIYLPQEPNISFRGYKKSDREVSREYKREFIDLKKTFYNNSDNSQLIEKS